MNGDWHYCKAEINKKIRNNNDSISYCNEAEKNINIRNSSVTVTVEKLKEII